MNDLTPIPPGIVLCSRCGARLSALKKLPAGAVALCTDCADEQASTRRLQAVRVPEWVSIDESPAPAPRRIPWAAIAAAALVVVGVLAFALRPSREVRPEVVVLAPEPLSPPPPVAEDAGQKALEAKREAEALRLRGLAEIQEDLAALDQETAGPEALEEYGRVFAMLEQAKARHGEETWARAVEERTALLRGKVDSHYAAVLQFASESRDPAEKTKLRERVAHWGLAAYAVEIEKAAVAPPTPPPPPRSKEAQAYLEEWERAMARAATRDYDRAFPELRKASRGLQEETLRREAATDLDDLQRVMMAVEAIGKAVAAWPRGTAIALEKVTGSVVSSDTDRVEVRLAGVKETVFVELSETAAPALAALVRGRIDARPLALFCLIEGHSEGVKALLDRPEEIPAKYWAWAAVARARLPAPDAEAVRRERSARDHYYAAEREWRSPGTRGMAVERYRALARDFLDTTLVRRAVKRITERSEGGREYTYSAGDMAGGGSFRKSKAGWISSSDSDFTRGHENFVELEFYAMPGEAYRAWVQVGGCCAETFSGAFYQVSDLIVPHPVKAGQKAAAEPGSLFAVAIAHPPVPLKPTHAAHGGAREPGLWGWIEVPLPKFPQAGAKRVRLVAVAKGFGVARAVVSSTRKAAPVDAELKDFEESREPAIPISTAPDEPGLALRLQEPGPDVADAPSLRIEGDLTIVLRLKVGAAPAEKALIVGKGENYSLWLLPGNRVLFQQSDVSGRVVLSVSPSKPIPIGRWVSVAALVRGGHGTVYLDGIPEAARGRTGLPATSSAPLSFGSCTIDEVRIYSKALTSEQIGELGKR